MIQVVMQGRRFVLVCWEAAQSPSVVMLREKGLAGEVNMPAAGPGTAGAEVAP